MKLDEIRALGEKELRAHVLELQEEQFRLRFRGATETLESPLRLREVRRDIARVLTILREKEIAAAPPSTKKRGKTRAARKSVARDDKQAATKRAAMKRVAKRGIRSTSAR